LLELRNRTYAAFVQLGRAPTAEEVGDAQTVREGWRSLHEAPALVLNPATDEIRMANPFSAVPSAYRVLANDRWWYANCADPRLRPDWRPRTREENQAILDQLRLVGPFWNLP
jgi:hypothetical protein